METKINTGGLKTFIYNKEDSPKASKEEILEIRKAYEKAKQRKKREKKIKGIVILIVIALLISYFIFFY